MIQKFYKKLGLPHHSVIRVYLQKKIKKSILWVWFNIFSKFLISKKKINISGHELFVDKKIAKELIDKLDELIVLAAMVDYEIKIDSHWGKAKRWKGHWVTIWIERKDNFIILQLLCGNINRILRKVHIRDGMNGKISIIQDVYHEESSIFEKIEYIRKKL